jgi:hypothetical protein
MSGIVLPVIAFVAILATFGAATVLAWELATWLTAWFARRPRA